MDDALVVGELKRVADLRHDGQRLARRDASGLQQLPQVHAVHEFHQEEKKAVGLAEFVQRDDAGMIQLRQRLGFAGEAFGERGVIADAGRKNLERDDAVQFLLPRLVNRAHAALADEFEDFELGKFRGEFGDGRRLERRRLPARGGFVGCALFQQAGGTKPGERAGGQRGAALRTFWRVGRVHFGATHIPNPEANHDGCYREN